MTCLVLVLLFLGTLTFTYPACCQTVQLPQTGQTKCYNTAGTEIACAGTGQDGDIQAGVAWPNPRFTVSGECVTDNLTGLMWPKNANLVGLNLLTWNEAIDFANNLTLCGHSDWRLPNMNELKSLINYDKVDNRAWLITQGFANLQTNDFYVSSTTVAERPGEAWVVALSDGYNSTGNKTGRSNAVWPARSGNGGAVAQIWRTGQTTSYRTGDDGDLRAGVA